MRLLLFIIKPSLPNIVKSLPQQHSYRKCNSSFDYTLNYILILILLTSDTYIMDGMG